MQVLITNPRHHILSGVDVSGDISGRITRTGPGGRAIRTQGDTTLEAKMNIRHMFHDDALEVEPRNPSKYATRQSVSGALNQVDGFADPFSFTTSGPQPDLPYAALAALLSERDRDCLEQGPDISIRQAAETV